MSTRYAYNYESTAPAPRPSRQQSQKRRLSVVPGAAKRPTELSPTFLFAAKVIAIGLVVLAALSFARIALNSATVALTLQSQEISASVDSARSAASSLEIQHSSLASPDRIKSEATALGMVAPAETQIITLSPDDVVVDESGALSLSGSLERIASTG